MAEITLETAAGAKVDAGPAEAVNARFDAAMNDAPNGDQAPPRRPKDPPADPAPRRRARSKAEAARTAPAAPAALDDQARADGVRGWVQIGAALAALTHKATGKDAYKADAITIASSADDWADACVKTAHASPEFAGWLDKVCAVGPFGALIATGLGVGCQLARNHRPSLSLPGTMDPAEIIAKAEAPEAPGAAPAAVEHAAA